uniref:Histone H2A/H2B/H3 domain-containing protein n=1 Tax=Ascaris lumbricoides TaxID=6252 RepID=A0A0M3HF07_ASCLU
MPRKDNRTARGAQAIMRVGTSYCVPAAPTLSTPRCAGGAHQPFGRISKKYFTKILEETSALSFTAYKRKSETSARYALVAVPPLGQTCFVSTQKTR